MFGREPVAIAFAIRSILLVAIVFGLDWTEVQLAAVMVMVEAVLAVITRSQVTPNQNVLLARKPDDPKS